ncbi:2Fe-2S iron-sulfur cluster-binding protein [Novosphingobium sp. KA1]|uniref:2Fe-2S iron-sulfur cluster-binding protein n=1 Tax=Novosphingobium sp. (strain KA1) TaxID=164608 RepID=UPI00082D95C0|nr:2Fe-2S iron-sulfur cluster-binding protein [Novosphingobium sp. KA1]
MRLRFVAADGAAREVDVPPTGSLMEAAVRNGVDGIVAQCGGACACATCHVIVPVDWFSRLPPPDEAETDMLECVEEPRPTSRLSCQIRLSAALDGLAVNLPASQL